jgi:hypothetical protein
VTTARLGEGNGFRYVHIIRELDRDLVNWTKAFGTPEHVDLARYSGIDFTEEGYIVGVVGGREIEGARREYGHTGFGISDVHGLNTDLEVSVMKYSKQRLQTDLSLKGGRDSNVHESVTTTRLGQGKDLARGGPVRIKDCDFVDVGKALVSPEHVNLAWHSGVRDAEEGNFLEVVFAWDPRGGGGGRSLSG